MTARGTLKKSTLDAVVEYYRRQGYVVKLEPGKADLPSSVGPFQPDLIAIRGNDKRFVVVIGKADHASPRRTGFLIDRLKNDPEWTLEYYYIKGRRDILEPVEETEPLSRKEITKRTGEATLLLSDGHREAALMIVWSALEAVMRNFAARRRLAVRGGAEAVSSALVANGFLDHSHHRLFQKVVPTRNAIVHGFRNPEIEEETITQLINLVPVIQRELEATQRSRAS